LPHRPFPFGPLSLPLAFCIARMFSFEPHIESPSEPLDLSLNKYSVEFMYSELAFATRSFDPSRCLGKGSFGAVYRGQRADGTDMAVKSFDSPATGGFEDEVRVLSRFRHPNLVILLGFARNRAQRFLVYEFLAGGDVFQRLQRSSLDGVSFPWRARISAAFDAASGLSHLHNSRPKVFHRDIKSANILLDHNGAAKMGDFGLACLSDTRCRQVPSASGTPGYTCPLYAERKLITEGSETYSFGVVLLEMLTGCPPLWFVNGPTGASEPAYLVFAVGGDAHRAMMWLDCKARWPKWVAQPLIDAAMRCTHMSEDRRPSFCELVSILSVLRDSPDEPAPVPRFGAPHFGPDLGRVDPVLPKFCFAPMPLLPEPANATAAPAAVEAAPKATFAAQPPGFQASEATAPSATFEVTAPLPMAAFAAPPALSTPTDAAAMVAAAEDAIQSPSPDRRICAALAPAGFPATAKKPRPLWSLECTFADGLGVEPTGLIEAITHSGPVDIAPMELKVGRRFQDAWFARALPREETRHLVSREHFHIQAIPAPGATGEDIAGFNEAGHCAEDERVPCNFHLTNMSTNGTSVNGLLLLALDSAVPLHEGDLIGLGTVVSTQDGAQFWPVIMFRFSLSDSLLRDAASRPTVQLPMPKLGTSSCTLSWSLTASAAAIAALAGAGADDQAPEREVDAVVVYKDANSAEWDDGNAAWLCTSLGGDVMPRFILEVGGQGMRADAPLVSRRIVHGPLRLAPPGSAFAPLTIGRCHSTPFWRELLHDEAFWALSRDHIVLEAARCGPTGRCGKGPSVILRSLTSRHPVRICNAGAEGDAEAVVTLQAGEACTLRHGDLVVISNTQLGSLWLGFFDLEFAEDSETLDANAVEQTVEAKASEGPRRMVSSPMFGGA